MFQHFLPPFSDTIRREPPRILFESPTRSLEELPGWGPAVFFLFTPWKFNIAPENGWLEDGFPFGIPYFQGLC